MAGKRGRRAGFRHSAETRARMSAASKVAWADPEIRGRMSAAKRKHSEQFVEQARALWLAHLTVSAIALRLGVGKSVISGSAHRYVFPRRPSPIVRKGA